MFSNLGVLPVSVSKFLSFCSGESKAITIIEACLSGKIELRLRFGAAGFALSMIKRFVVLLNMTYLSLASIKSSAASQRFF